MTNERKEELVRELFAFASEQGNTRYDTVRKVAQEIMSDIDKTINPCKRVLVPFYIMAMEYAAQSLRARFSKEAEIANDLKSIFTCYGIEFPHRNSK